MPFAQQLPWNPEEDNELGDAGRQALAQRILEAFAAFYEDDADELKDSSGGSGEIFPTETPTQNQELPHLEAHEVCSPGPNNLQELLAGVLPELLQRAAARCVSVIADGCHLQAFVRAELRAALLHFPGRVRWVIMIPNTLRELLERQGQTQPEEEEWSGSTLPGVEGDCNFALHEVEFGEGRDRRVFQDWLGQVCPETSTAAANCDACDTSQTPGMQVFFAKFGNATGYLSTEGTRRYWKSYPVQWCPVVIQQESSAGLRIATDMDRSKHWLRVQRDQGVALRLNPESFEESRAIVPCNWGAPVNGRTWRGRC